jgi:hypothetical protein
MRKLIWLTLIIATLVASLFLVANVHASTPVSGTITADTTWTQANSPYTLTGTVYVNSGVTLTIQPGVNIDLSSYSLQVSGTLIAVGASDNQIVFTTGSFYSNVRVTFNSASAPWNEYSGSGCVVKNAVFNVVTVSIIGCSPKISNNYFTNSLYTAVSGSSGGSPLILNNAFSGQTTAISFSSGSPTISGNFIRLAGVVGISGISAGSSTALISDNNITRCYYGVSTTGYATITRNQITSCSIGVYSISAYGTIENNTISGNVVGIFGGGAIRNNTIGNNTVGLTATIASSNITQNNFINNIQYSVGVSQNSVDASYNWWGTTDVAAINQMIYDSKNVTGYGTVNFVPFLTEPNPNAPALGSIYYVPAPTPTPIPTPIPNPTSTPFPIQTYSPPPPSNISLGPTPTPTQEPTRTPSPTPLPTPSPTPKVLPGSPLSLGGSTFAEEISQFDIVGLAKLVLLVLGIMWVIIILVSVDRKFGKGDAEKQ